MGFPGMWELLVILAIVLLIFGPKRIKGLGADLGNAIKGFRNAVTDEDAAKKEQTEEKVIEGEASTSEDHVQSEQKSKV
ncbi:MAG: twin-arginine translocase TatA/TatE family subunit [Pseudomonadota bacterium]